MPAIWASSERPLFVRTVWIDGIRHAILSPDDPVVNPRLHRHRPRTSKEKSLLAMHQQTETRLDRLSSCFMNLHVVVEKNFPDDKVSSSTRIVRRQSAPPCARICADKTGGLLEIYMNDIDNKSDNGGCRSLGKEEMAMQTGKSDFTCNSDVEQSFCLQRDKFSVMTECKQVDRSSDTRWNPLSERVLQWLDLSGRAQNYKPEMESEEGSKFEDDRRWGSARRRRHLPRRRDSSVSTGRERIAVQNYKFQKNCKLECVMKAMEAKFARKRLSETSDATEDEVRKEESTASVLTDVTNENGLKDENESRDERENLLTVWTPPGRLQLHIVMPNFSSVEKRASSLESLACD